MLRKTAVTLWIAAMGMMIFVSGAVGGEGVKGSEKLQQNIELSQVTTEGWLKLLDNGKYGESWDKAALMFRNTIKKDEWIKTMDKQRKPLGSVISRNILDIRTAQNPKGLPAGDYMVFFYKTSFSKKNDAFELVTLVQQQNGEWYVLTYQVN